MAANAQLLALMAGPPHSKPKTLYDLGLESLVVSFNTSVPSLDRIYKLRELPRNILIDVYEMMSQHESLKDTLLEELADLNVFLRLLPYAAGRVKLFRIVASLMASKKMVTQRLCDAYIQRFGVVAVESKQLQQLHQELQQEQQQQQQIQPFEITISFLDDLAALSSSSKAVRKHAKPPNFDSYKYKDNDDKDEHDNDNVGVDVDAVDDDDEDDDEDEDYGVDKMHRPMIYDGLQLSSEEVAENELIFAADWSAIDAGLRLGTFLSESGWMQESASVLSCLNQRLKLLPGCHTLLITRLDCLQRLLYATSAHCNFKWAEDYYNEVIEISQWYKDKDVSTLTMVYSQISAMFFARNEYDNSHVWSMLALRHLSSAAPPKVIVDVLRQAAKACVVKRDFSRANLLISQAMRRARLHFGKKHQKYGDTLLDYGFFLLHVDSVSQCVNVYKEALAIRRSVFGNFNFHVAIAHEDLSYAYYVHEYSSGDFSCAQSHVHKAVEIMKQLVPSNHLMLASAKRVKALLLEEIALDKMTDGLDEDGLLFESEQLHKFALQLSLEVFGINNVQTAKHYGNLGRLYQTMNRFEEAERMHLKAIQIKTGLLGRYDYEVGLSIGHLASLYNYQMKKYREAEDLYLRSIEISLRLFGRSYSGLEYDYLGLCHVYETLHDFEKYLRYASILENWQMLRGQNITQNKSAYPAIEEDYAIEELKYRFFNMKHKGPGDDDQHHQQHHAKNDDEEDEDVDVDGVGDADEENAAAAAAGVN